MNTTLSRLLAVAMLASITAGCIKPPGPATAPPPATVYENVFVPGSSTANPGIIRINVATGQTITAFGAPSQMTAIPDLPLPAGQYHLTLWSQPAASDGSVSWGVADPQRRRLEPVQLDRADAAQIGLSPA
jgi:hypothetical protein